VGTEDSVRGFAAGELCRLEEMTCRAYPKRAHEVALVFPAESRTTRTSFRSCFKAESIESASNNGTRVLWEAMKLDRKVPRGLRELKKQRTTETIIRVAMDLFSEHGYQATTLIDIAAAAEIAPSTLYSYFPTKRDIVFSHQTMVLDSAKSFLLLRPESESTIEALEKWVSIELPALAGSYGAEMQTRREVIDANEELLAEERLRFAMLEDVFAEAFAQDLEEGPNELRSRLLAAIANAGLRAVFRWAYQRDSAERFEPRDAYLLDSMYLTKILSAAEDAISQIPQPV
jgi:AcrR family transcriptional regulator